MVLPLTRSIAGVVVALAALALPLGSAAEASCAPPAPVAQNAAGAEVVVHGRVSSIGGGLGIGGSVTFQVQRVLKGTTPSAIRVHLGPVPGTPTSVDYSGALVGSEHVLYLRMRSGEYTTDACNGSHAGGPRSDEVAQFGSGTAPTAGGGGLIDTVSTQVALALAVTALALLAALILLRQRVAPKRPGTREAGSAERV